MRNIEVITRPDGAEWHSFDVNHCNVILTSRGREVFAEQPELEERVHLYLGKALGDQACKSADVRTFFMHGSNSYVYHLTDDILVKETNAHSMKDALFRMDRIYEVVKAEQSKVPRWIHVPDYYGMITGPDLPNQYVFMQRIDSGVNVDHILNTDDYNELERAGLNKQFGPVTETDKKEVSQRYADMEQILHQALADHGLVPTKFLTDWWEPNVLVERLAEPLDGSSFRMSVIDQ